MTTNNNDMSKLLRDSFVSSFLWKPRSRCAGSAMNVLFSHSICTSLFPFPSQYFWSEILDFHCNCGTKSKFHGRPLLFRWCDIGPWQSVSHSLCLSVEGNQFLVHTTVFEARTVLTLNILWLIVGQLFHNNCRKGDWKLCCLRNLTLGHLIYTSAHTLE